MSMEFFETVDVSANLYKKYQMAIHENTPSECDKKSFLNFLVKSPLQVNLSKERNEICRHLEITDARFFIFYFLAVHTIGRAAPRIWLFPRTVLAKRRTDSRRGYRYLALLCLERLFLL